MHTPHQIYEKTCKIYFSAMESNRGLEMAERHLLATLNSLAKSGGNEDLRETLRGYLIKLQDRLHHQLDELGE